MQRELGYYTCGSKIFGRKLEAMLFANDNFSNAVRWHFNDEKYNSYNWSIEPEVSLDFLYDLRAREIREKYDYVILSYSGGVDSNNILESFLRQNLFIDEIVTNWSLDVGDKFVVHDKSIKESWNTNAEFSLHTRHRLDYIRNKSPKTKITVLDSSKTILDSLLNNSDADWINNKNDVFNVTGAFQYNPLFFPDVRKRLDSLGNVAYVLGLDKPKLLIRDNKLFLYFIDKVTSIIPLRENITDYNNISIVLFYWAPECCDLMCKQAHTVYKYIKNNPKAKKVWETTDVHMMRIVQEQLLRNIIYDTWNNDWFQVKKPTSDWDSELDYWFTRGWSGTREHSIWMDGLKNLTPRISNFLKYENGVPKGTKPFFSKMHYIGSFEKEIMK